MNARVSLVLVLSFWTCVSLAQTSQEFRTAANAWEIASSQKGLAPETEAAFREMRAAWESLPQNQKTVEFPRLALAYVARAENHLASSEPNEAAAALKSAGTLNQQFGGRLEYATKSPDAFFDRLAKLEVGIAEVTGSDPLSGMVDYLFRKEGDKYIVAREELYPEVKGITVDGIGESEALAQVLQLSAQDGHVTIDKTRWVVGPKGRAEDTVRRATREVSFDRNGRLSAKQISTPVFGGREAPPQSPATPAAVTAEPSTPVATAPPPVSSPTAPIDGSPAPVVERKPPVWPRVVGGILAAMIVGIVVFILRRKST